MTLIMKCILKCLGLEFCLNRARDKRKKDSENIGGYIDYTSVYSRMIFKHNSGTASMENPISPEPRVHFIDLNRFRSPSTPWAAPS